MRELDIFDEESSSTLFRDVIMLALAGFVTLVMLILIQTRAGRYLICFATTSETRRI